jgi:predicted AAA+ superfamily ATPase
MYIERKLTGKLQALAAKFPVIFLTGPRQSGKSTLVKRAFSDYDYVNLEEKDQRDFAVRDPRGFLDLYGDKAIIDEAQRAPDLFSYIQTKVDEDDRPGRYLLSGSQNFLILRSISQSLAGRVGILTLLPLSLAERFAGPDDMPATDEWLYRGAYPRLLAQGIDPVDYYPSYVDTYVERDVRNETGVHDIGRFKAFLKVCAARTGTPVNFTDIGKELSADARTVASWLNILEESYVIFRLRPWYKNIGKRQTRTPKLYFYDTGLLCSLLGIDEPGLLRGHSMRGYLFENAVITEIAKAFYNEGKRPPLYFWRDSGDRDREIDLLIEKAGALDLIEIKSAATAITKYTKNIHSFARETLTGSMPPDGQGPSSESRAPVPGKFVVYDGPDGLRIAETVFLNWRRLRGGRIFDSART